MSSAEWRPATPPSELAGPPVSPNTYGRASVEAPVVRQPEWLPGDGPVGEEHAKQVQEQLNENRNIKSAKTKSMSFANSQAHLLTTDRKQNKQLTYDAGTVGL